MFFSFYFNTHTTRSAQKKGVSPISNEKDQSNTPKRFKALSNPEEDQPNTPKRFKTLSNPDEDHHPLFADKKSTCSPTSSTSTIENHRINNGSIGNRKELLKNVTTPLSSKKRRSTVQKNSSTKSLASVDHNKQYVIDAGQKDFDGLTTCNDCGMVYTKGVKEDELHHKTFHDSIIGSSDAMPSAVGIRTPAKRITISPSPKSLSLKLKSLKWSLNSKTIKERVLEWVQLSCLNAGGSGRIIGFTSDELLKNEKLLNLVDKYFRKAGQEIGIESGIMEYNQLFMHLPDRASSIFLLMIVSESKKNGINSSSKKGNTPKSSKASTPKSVKNAAAAVVTPVSNSNTGDYVIGLVACESITSAEKLISENPLSCSTNENIPAKIGISRLWTSSAFRRQNVATQLLDALRRHFMTMTANTSQVVPKDEVAFSDPTEHGLKFAQKYFDRKDILVFSLFHSLTPAAIEEL